VKDGVGVISLSPKGITAVCIDGLSPKVSFQKQLARTKPVASQSDADELEATVLSFGPELRWLYGYLKKEPDMIEQAELSVTAGGDTRIVADKSFPFEFSVPIGPETNAIEMKTRLMKKTGSDEASSSNEDKE
jgi:hypothetical protein